MTNRQAIGKGNFNFSELFCYLHDNNLSPMITLEPHSEDDLWESIDALKRMNVVRLGTN